VGGDALGEAVGGGAKDEGVGFGGRGGMREEAEPDARHCRGNAGRSWGDDDFKCRRGL